MNDAIQQRVEQFVQEILSLVQRAREESRGAALNKVTIMLAEPQKPADAARSSRGSPGRARMTSAATGEAAPKTSAKSDRRARSALEAAAATQRSPPSGAMTSSRTGTSPASADVVPTVLVPSSSESASNGTASPSSDREAAVLDAVRSLVRATASEIAGRCGQPNGSVSVVLRGLVARGQVAKAETTRGIEYSLVSAGSVRPFKRVRDLGAADARTVDQASAADVALVAD